MASYQDIDSRLAAAERKIDFIMRTFQVQKRTQQAVSLDGRPTVRVESKNLLEVYRELQALGAEAIPVSEIANGPDSDSL